MSYMTDDTVAKRWMDCGCSVWTRSDEPVSASTQSTVTRKMPELPHCSINIVRN